MRAAAWSTGKCQFAGLLCKALWRTRTADPLLTIATGRNPRQRFWLIFVVFEAEQFAADCHRLQPRGSIKAPYPTRDDQRLDPRLRSLDRRSRVAAGRRTRAGGWLVRAMKWGQA